MRPLREHRSQIPVVFLADVHLGLVLSRVPASRPQPGQMAVFVRYGIILPFQYTERGSERLAES